VEAAGGRLTAPEVLNSSGRALKIRFASAPVRSFSASL